MALVFCRSCKAKITQRDTTCPRCGAPTSRLVPIVTGIIVSAVAVVLYSAVKASLQDDKLATARNSPVADTGNRAADTASTPSAPAQKESGQRDIVRTVLTDD
jgi:hypothetical protein